MFGVQASFDLSVLCSFVFDKSRLAHVLCSLYCENYVFGVRSCSPIPVFVFFHPWYRLTKGITGANKCEQCEQRTGANKCEQCEQRTGANSEND